MTAVDRATRCIVGWAVVWERSQAALQDLLDASPSAQRYYSDAFSLYQSTVYAGVHQAMPDKSQTYSVKGDNAKLCHDLARLQRASRFFSRSLEVLRTAVRLFVFAWNHPQLTKRRFPTYPAHVAHFSSVLS